MDLTGDLVSNTSWTDNGLANCQGKEDKSELVSRMLTVIDGVSKLGLCFLEVPVISVPSGPTHSFSG